MAEAEVAAVKETLQKGNASDATVLAVRRLLQSAADHATNTKGNTAKKNHAPAQRNTSQPKAKLRKQQAVLVCEDASVALSALQQYTLATEVVNTCLKILSDSAKQPNHAVPRQKTPHSPRRTSTLSDRALKSRSSNSTPTKPRLNESKPNTKKLTIPASSTRNGINSDVVHIARCADFAFACLESASPQNVGVRARPTWELENGMLSFAGKLTAHGLDAMATNSLLRVKGRIESHFGTSTKTKSERTGPRDRTASMRETPATSLNFNCSQIHGKDALSVAVAYHFRIIKLLAGQQDHSAIEDAVQHLAADGPNGPVNLVIQLGEASGDNSKAAKQLDQLSQTILSMCPSVGFDADETAQDAKKTPSPKAVFELQVLALHIRNQWWKLAKHEANVFKELLDPFWKCATAFVRRSRRSGSASATYESVTRSFKSLGSGNPKFTAMSHFNIHNMLCCAAEEAGRYEEARRWVEKMSEDCASLEDNHALRLVAIARETILLIKCLSAHVDLDALVKFLARNLAGNEPHFDLLLTALSDLTRCLSDYETSLDAETFTLLIGRAAGFATRFSRTYPLSHSECVRQILDAALRSCKTTDQLLLWVTEDAVRAFAKSGALGPIARDAATQPLATACTRSSTATSFSRILQALVLKNARSHKDGKASLFFDDDTLSLSERAPLLELQLISLLDLTSKVKYHDALQKIVPELSQSLLEIYSKSSFPIRRARVAIVMLRLCESHYWLFSSTLFDQWSGVRLDCDANLGEDAGLQPFYEDIRASLTITRSFHHNRPSFEDLKPSLLVWEQIYNTIDDSTKICQKVDNPAALMQQLNSIASYFCMLGEGNACLETLKLLVRFAELLEGSSDTLYNARITLARQFLHLGYAEEASAALERVAPNVKAGQGSILTRLDYYTTSAECLVATGNLERCRMSLDKAQEQRSQWPPENVPKGERIPYGITHARAWFVHSKCSLESGDLHDALLAAKHCVKIINKIWLEVDGPRDKSQSNPIVHETEPAEVEVQALSKGITKLQLQPKDTIPESKKDGKAKKGAAFWLLVPILCQAFLHISDLYAYHGVFAESNYYSEKAVRVAESVGSVRLLSRLRSHRSRFLVLAGQTQDAELCLAQDEKNVVHEPSLALVERYCALASVRGQENPAEATALYEKAEAVISCIAAGTFTGTIGSFTSDVDQLENRVGSTSSKGRPRPHIPSADRELQATVTSHTAPLPKTKSRQVSQRLARATVSTSRTSADAKADNGSHCVLEKLRTDIAVRKALLKVLDGQDMRSLLPVGEQYSLHAVTSFDLVHAQFQELLRRAIQTLEMDVVLNVLLESSLSIPALKPLALALAPRSKVVSKASSGLQRVKGPSKSAMRPSKKEASAQEDFVYLFEAAREVLLKAYRTGFRSYGTTDIHRACAMLLKAGSLLFSISKSNAVGEISSLSESLIVELPRSRALEKERFSVSLDGACEKNSELLCWPAVGNDQGSTKTITTLDFQKDFVDILPRCWTAVSLCLNEDASEIYVARYDCNRTPLVLRLPFSRHKPDELHEEVFDYHRGKAELQEIIDLSNYSCHNPGAEDDKARKTKWWTERQALDRQLHELLINMEDIWFGGFKAVFAQFTPEATKLERFRKSFEDILDRHLPSRQAAKRQDEKHSFEDRVLELFIGLGHDHDGTVDLDDQLCDLLYFVVDILQFSGERNAYDEIDFDSMAVDVLDALRSYHERSTSSDNNARHLVLVLDRRLQAFPWENLPCLQESNVSRVGSMLSLRERILAQRASASKRAHGRSDAHASIPATGTYILNPSSDLPRTQTFLEPTLDKLGTKWNSIVGQAPDEARFASAITNSSILLYFGHGPGSQFIRPRTIRKLDTCCNVAWLIGCSSGAVTEHGDLEPSAVPLAYLLAGSSGETEGETDKSDGLCQAVVATLWDVTDRDIDRFSLRLGEEWGLWAATEDSKLPLKTPKKRERVAAPSTPQRAPKTPKTPKVLKSPVPFKTPARDPAHSARDRSQRTSLVEALSRSREACYLRYLNGAAPVVYGVPVYLEE